MVRFNPKARLDRSRVRDVGNSGGGIGGGSGMRIPIPGGIGGKGGLGGLLLVIGLVILGPHPTKGWRQEPHRRRRR